MKKGTPPLLNLRHSSAELIMMESLEVRRLRSASLSGDGLLSVVGTAKDDVITLSASTRRLYVHVNGQDTSFRIGTVEQIRVSANRGNDQVNLGSIDIASTLSGAGGNDQLIGGAGNDVLNGGSSSDLLGGGVGGNDMADYSDHTVALRLNIGGGRNDGEAGENDNIAADVENITGGSKGDRITGNGGANILTGGHGSDAIYGGDGNDTIFGNDGDDHMYGEGGNDTIDCGDGDNYLSGGDGDDLLDAHNGSTDDSVNGGAGHDYAKRDKKVGFFGNEDKDQTDEVEERGTYDVDE
jgi:Ca2+-binding RTX toxin-like protein